MKLPSLLCHLAVFTVALLPLTSVRAARAETPKKVLVVTVTTGIPHSSIPMAEKALAQLAADFGKFTVDFVQQPPGMPKAPTRPRPGPAGVNEPAHQEALKKFAEAENAY